MLFWAMYHPHSWAKDKSSVFGGLSLLVTFEDADFWQKNALALSSSNTIRSVIKFENYQLERHVELDGIFWQISSTLSFTKIEISCTCQIRLNFQGFVIPKKKKKKSKNVSFNCQHVSFTNLKKKQSDFSFGNIGSSENLNTIVK